MCNLLLLLLNETLHVVCKHNGLANSAASGFNDSFQSYKCWRHNTACPSEPYAERLGYVLQGVVTPTGAILRGATQVTYDHWVAEGFSLQPQGHEGFPNGRRQISS